MCLPHPPVATVQSDLVGPQPAKILLSSLSTIPQVPWDQRFTPTMPSCFYMGSLFKLRSEYFYSIGFSQLGHSSTAMIFLCLKHSLGCVWVKVSCLCLIFHKIQPNSLVPSSFTISPSYSAGLWQHHWPRNVKSYQCGLISMNLFYFTFLVVQQQLCFWLSLQVARGLLSPSSSTELHSVYCEYSSH